MNPAPIFIIGTERSGSNLLRLILNTHSAITVPHPPHIMKFFAPLEGNYGDLSLPENLKILVDDVLGLVKAHIYPWEHQPSAAKVIGNICPPDLLGVFFGIYNAYLRQSGKQRWGCKSTFMIHHIARILAACPQAKFLFLVRDPRDVAASSRKSIFSPFHPYFTASLWRQQQLAGLRLYDKAPNSCQLIRYEDLIERPETTIRMICDFLGEKYEAAMLEFHRTGSAQKSESLCESWGNTASPILANNQKKFMTELSPAEIRLVEAVTGDLMSRFGYPLASGIKTRELAYKPSAIARWQYKLLNMLWALRAEIRSMRHDKNYRQFWRRRIFLIRLRLRLRFMGGFLRLS